MTPKERAVMQQALDFIDYFVFNGDNATKAKSISTALREALAEPELNLNCKSVQKRLAALWGYVKAEQAEQEPVAWICHKQNGEKSLWWNKNQALDRNAGHEFTPLYAAPVRTKDMTDEEIVSLINSVWFLDELMVAKVNFARAVIAADRSKNGII